MSVNSKMKAIADAIRAKTGSTDALTLDGMAEAVAGIEAGGGGGSFVGKITVAEDTTSITIDHGLGKIPDVVSVVLCSTTLTLGDKTTFFISSNKKAGARGVFSSSSGKTYILISYPNTESHGINAGTFLTADSQTLSFNVPSATMKFAAGVEYLVSCAISE